MLSAPKVLFGPVQLTGSDVTEYTSPANTFTTVTRCVFTNVNTIAVTLTVNVVRAGNSVAATNAIISAYTLSAGEDYEPAALAGMILGAGDFISCKAGTATSINAWGSGYTS